EAAERTHQVKRLALAGLPACGHPASGQPPESGRRDKRRKKRSGGSQETRRWSKGDSNSRSRITNRRFRRTTGHAGASDRTACGRDQETLWGGRRGSGNFV